MLKNNIAMFSSEIPKFFIKNMVDVQRSALDERSRTPKLMGEEKSRS